MAVHGSSTRARARPEVDDAASTPPLVEAKLAVPSLRRSVVDRPRINRAFDAGADAALTLVAAPAGYGKTTAVRAWCATTDAALSWVTLDAGDNDVVRLWRYIATAVDRVRGGLGRIALQRLVVPGGTTEDAVDELVNGVAAFRRPLLLVLDDFHTVTNLECLASLDRAFKQLPANARVILVTRVDPQLRLAALRAAGALSELRAADLAFAADEADQLLVQRGGLALGREEIDVLVERTEGWPAALVLAGLWLGRVADPASAVREFGGSHRFVADYLASEVLGALDDDRHRFLHGTAVLGQFTPALCDAVLDRSDSAAVLDELERMNLFILRLERGSWFRMHSLFAEYARAELASVDPEAAPRIHERAAEWLLSRGLPVEAVEHASAAGDHELVARLLVQYHDPLMRSGGSRTVLRWIETLPEDRLVAHPELPIAAAMATLLIGGRGREQERYLRLAECANEGRRAPSDPYFESWPLVIRTLAFDGGVARAVVNGRRAVELAEEGFDRVIDSALGAYARALYFAGRLDEAASAAARALEHPDIGRRHPTATHVCATLALVAAERGRPRTARRWAEAAKAAAGRIGTARSWLGASAAAALGVVLEAEGSLAEAEQELATAERFFADETANLHEAWLLVLLARVRAGRGRLDEAEAALGAAREALDELLDPGRVPALADDVARELEAARHRARSGEVLEPPSEAELAVLRLLASDLTAREIGERLFLSPNTIRSHKRALYRKLGVHSQAEAVARATALGLLAQAHSPR